MEAGWTYGQVYDADKKQHPNLRSFQSLPNNVSICHLTFTYLCYHHNKYAKHYLSSGTLCYKTCVRQRLWKKFFFENYFLTSYYNNPVFCSTPYWIWNSFHCLKHAKHFWLRLVEILKVLFQCYIHCKCVSASERVTYHACKEMSLRGYRWRGISIGIWTCDICLKLAIPIMTKRCIDISDSGVPSNCSHPYRKQYLTVNVGNLQFFSLWQRADCLSQSELMRERVIFMVCGCYD